MDKTLQHKILAAVIAAGTLGLYTANPVNAENYYTVYPASLHDMVKAMIYSQD